MNRLLISLLALWSASASFGQGTLGIPNSFFLTLDEMPSEQTFRDLTRHVRLTLPPTYFTGPIVGGGEDIGIIGIISPGLIDGFTPIGTFPGVLITHEFLLEPEIIGITHHFSEIREFTGDRGLMPPPPPISLIDVNQNFTGFNSSFVKLPGDRVRRIVIPVSSVSGDAPLTVPEPGSIVLLSLAGLGCWLLRRRA
jgi:hypothetical protein